MLEMEKVLPLRGNPTSKEVVRSVPLSDVTLMALTVFLLSSLYFSVLLKLMHDWFILPDFSHGFLIPFFVGYLVWSQRGNLRVTPLAPSWAGLWVLVTGLGLLLLGTLGSELFLARISLLFVTAGIVWLLAGREMLFKLRLPLAV